MTFIIASMRVAGGTGEGVQGRTFVAVHHFYFMTLFLTASYDCISQTPDESTRFLTFSKNHRRKSKVLFFPILLLHRCCISSFSQ